MGAGEAVGWGKGEGEGEGEGEGWVVTMAVGGGCCRAMRPSALVGMEGRFHEGSAQADIPFAGVSLQELEFRAPAVPLWLHQPLMRRFLS